ncbi:MAG: hypothetical protein IMW89_16330 [Ktedonobacteraceae bacterium]|nr:hypothetical protein [Ktedonobacteraceae bacterium]
MNKTYREILRGVSPWVALGFFMHDFFRSRSSKQRERLLRAAVREPASSTPEQHQWAVFCAASAEYLSLKYNLPCPEWVNNPRYVLTEPWFTSKIATPEWQEQVKAETPEPFARRNIFCGDRIFANKYELAEDLQRRRSA